MLKELDKLNLLAEWEDTREQHGKDYLDWLESCLLTERDEVCRLSNELLEKEEWIDGYCQIQE
jgi:hypothetical protein